MTWKKYLKPEELVELQKMERQRDESAAAFVKFRRLLQSRCQSRARLRKAVKDLKT